MLRLDKVTKHFGARSVLNAVSLEVAAGEYVAVLGESGIGKSTLLNVIAGLEPVDAGTVSFDGVELTRLDDDALTRLRRERFGFVFQAFHVLPHLSAAENVGLPLLLRRAPQDEIRRRAAAALAAVGLAAVADKPIGTLSGGQTRRVLFARTMLQDAAAILLDEPLANVDTDTTAQLLGVMERWCEEGRIVVAVLHDLDLAQRHFGWTMLLAHESVACGPTAQVLTPDNLSEARHLCERCAADRNFWAAA